MENFTERGPERILSKEEVLNAIRRYAENVELVRELSDQQGLYLLEVKVVSEHEKEGETTQLEYVRKGRFPNTITSSDTSIHKVYYKGDMPVGGDKVAAFNNETGEWVDA